MNRAVGSILGSAVGDALGATYEFKPAVLPPALIEMRGNSTWLPGEWTDDTSMALPILTAIASGWDLRTEPTLDFLVSTWVEWMQTAKDVGLQTRRVLSASEGRAALAFAASEEDFRRTGAGGGNGSLMRTTPIALGYLKDPSGLTEAARTVSMLTHFEPDAGDACVIWAHTIRAAILTGTLDFAPGLDALPTARTSVWSTRINDATGAEPWDFPKNGRVVHAFQAAVAAVTRGGSFQDIVTHAVRCGWDTDTVAAIAGGLAGALHGADRIPSHWVGILHGWPGINAERLGLLASTAVTRAQ